MRFAHKSLKPLLDVQRKYASVGSDRSGDDSVSGDFDVNEDSVNDRDIGVNNEIGVDSTEEAVEVSLASLERKHFDDAYLEVEGKFLELSLDIFNPSSSINVEQVRSKKYRAKKEGQLKMLVMDFLCEEHEEVTDRSGVFEKLMKNAMRTSALDSDARQDMRGLEEVR